MNPNEEQFDDFKVAEESPEMENVVANTIVAKELTEVEQYKEEVLDEIFGMADSPKDELTQLVVGYIQAMGDVDQVSYWGAMSIPLASISATTLSTST